MQDTNVKLDDNASELYNQLEGIKKVELSEFAPLDAEKLAESLREEERKFDSWRAILGKVVYYVSSYLHMVNKGQGADKENAFFVQLGKVLNSFKDQTFKDDTILIRYRGSTTISDSHQKVDYEVFLGEIGLDLQVVPHMIARVGDTIASMTGQLTKAFGALWNLGITNLSLKIPKDPSEFKRLKFALSIVSRYNKAIEKDQPITFIANGKQVAVSPAQNERNQNDPNLTLLAALNGLKPQTITELAKKVDTWRRRPDAKVTLDPFLDSYSAILQVKKLREKLKPSPVEFNSTKWLIVDNEEETVTAEMAEVARIVMENSGQSQVKGAQVLKSVYGKDYKNIDSQQIVKRLDLTTGLLNTIDNRPEEKHIGGEVIENVEKRLEKVKDEVYEDLVIDGKKVKSKSAGEEASAGQMHSELVKSVSFYKNRSVANKKMKALVHEVVDFDEQDYETLAKDFDVSIAEAQQLINMLNGCFDGSGFFKKGAFGRILPEFNRYEKRIFEFLWHHLKETLHQKDRSAFLDSLQQLVERLKQPKKSISVLLADLSENPTVVKYADSKAYMLGSRLVRKYTQDLVSYQITPEDVLLDDDGIDKDIADYAAWKIDRERLNFLTKIKTTHLRLLESLDVNDQDTLPMNAQYLLSQERESLIFLSLVGGSTAKSVLTSAIQEYGRSNSTVYYLKNSKENLADIMQLLKVAIRGMGRIGDTEDISSFDHVKARASELMGLGKSMHHQELINQILEWVDKSKQSIYERE